MKNYLIIGLLSFSFVSCNDVPQVKEKIIIEKYAAEIPAIDDFQYDSLQGMYVGDFGGSDIRIILNYVSHKNAIGYNLHKGLIRNLNGKVSKNGDSIQIIMNEPGDDKFDGIFTLDFINHDNKPKGIWESGSGNYPSKKFKLSKINKREGGSEDEITLSNFADFFNYLSDTIGDYHFKEDGLCLFEYYKTVGKDEAEQLTEIKGTWSLSGKTVSIDWQDNKVFPKGKMILQIYTGEYEEISLKGKNHGLYNHFYGP